MITCEGCPYPDTCTFKSRCVFRQTAKVALRTAAVEWVGHMSDPPTDGDKAFKKLEARLMRAAAKLGSMTQKRGYSKDFTPRGKTGKRYLLDSIPAGLWTAVREKCKREGVSIRALILKLLKDWIEK